MLGFPLAYIHSVNLTSTVFCLSIVSACSTTVQLLFRVRFLTVWNPAILRKDISNNVSNFHFVIPVKRRNTPLSIKLLALHHHHHHHQKHPGFGHLAHSISRATVALSNISSVFQLFSFLVGCSGMILKRFGLVAFFAGGSPALPLEILSCVGWPHDG